MEKQINSENSLLLKAEKKEQSYLLRKLPWFIRTISQHFNFYILGGFEYTPIGDIYVEWVWDIKGRFRAANCPPNIYLSDELIARLSGFLEDAVKNHAVVYSRNWNGFTWYLYDEKAYAECCKRHGFSEIEYQNPPPNLEETPDRKYEKESDRDK